MRTLPLLFLLAACTAPTSVELPKAWASSPPSVFEAQVESLPTELRWDSVEVLAAALEEPGVPAVRAAVLLARDSSRAATEAMISRLEQRHSNDERALDAGDIVCAAALRGRGVGARLAVLATGEGHHPDVEVRVACARTALAEGREEVVPFLLTVLRALTPAEAEHPPDWERFPTMMWAKTQAGEALAEHLGEPSRVRPDASWEDQMLEADRLEELILQESR